MAEKKETKGKHKRFGEHIPKEAREHAKAARAEFRKGVESIMPPKFVEHHRAARREMLMAAREMLNYAIDRLEDK